MPFEVKLFISKSFYLIPQVVLLGHTEGQKIYNLTYLDTSIRGRILAVTADLLRTLFPLFLSKLAANLESHEKAVFRYLAKIIHLIHLFYEAFDLIIFILFTGNVTCYQSLWDKWFSVELVAGQGKPVALKSNHLLKTIICGQLFQFLFKLTKMTFLTNLLSFSSNSFLT